MSFDTQLTAITFYLLEIKNSRALKFVYSVKVCARSILVLCDNRRAVRLKLKAKCIYMYIKLGNIAFIVMKSQF